MHNDDTSVRALIAGYKAVERPSAATEAKIRRALASAQRHSPAPPPSAQRGTVIPWLALAAALILLLAWQAGAPGRVSRDRGAQSSYTAATATPALATTRPEPQRTAQGLAPAVADDSTTPPEPPTGAHPPAGKRRKPPRPLAPDRVLEEMDLLQRAQEALRAQRPAEALAVLDRHADAFPRGDLAEEREALRVTALCAAGASQEGLALRVAFMRAYPRSAYAGRVAVACPEAAEND